MTYNEENRCVSCDEHFADAHQPFCPLHKTETFLPPTEEEVRLSIAKLLQRRASEACYWKEMFEDKNMPESADFQRTIEAIWNEATDIAMGRRD